MLQEKTKGCYSDIEDNPTQLTRYWGGVTEGVHALDNSTADTFTACIYINCNGFCTRARAQPCKVKSYMRTVFGITNESLSSKTAARWVRIQGGFGLVAALLAEYACLINPAYSP